MGDAWWWYLYFINICSVPFINAFTDVVNVSIGAVRLYRNGVADTSQSWSSGIVQIYYGYEWGNICDDSSFGSDEADVICHQLGYTGASSYSNTGNTTIFENDSANTLLNEVYCSTKKFLALTQCSFSTNVSSNCSKNNDVIVMCYPTRIWDSPSSGDIRLTGGAYSNQGLLEVYCNGEWGTVCDHTFNDTQAKTACTQLGYNHYYHYSHVAIRNNISSRSVWLEYFYGSCTSIYCLTECAYNGCNNAVGSSFCSSPSNDVTLDCGYNEEKPNVYAFTTDSCDTDNINSPPTFNYAIAWIPSTPIIILVIVVPIVFTTNRYIKHRRRKRWRLQQEAIESREEQQRMERRIHDQELAQLNTNTLQNAIQNQYRNEFSMKVLVPPRGEPPSYADTVGVSKNSALPQPEQPLLTSTESNNDSESVSSVNLIQSPSGPPPPFEPSNNQPFLAIAPPTYRDVV